MVYILIEGDLCLKAEGEEMKRTTGLMEDN